MREVGGREMNRDVKFPRWIEDSAYWLGKTHGQYGPRWSWFREFVRRRAAQERERHDRPNPGR